MRGLCQGAQQNKFKPVTIESDVMKAALDEWVKIYRGNAPWVADQEKRIESFNFAKMICNETARLVTLAMSITVKGSVRADWINRFMDSYITRMKNEICEMACAFGYIILKPNGEGIDYVMPWEFYPTHATEGRVDGGIFVDCYHEPGDSWYYTRLEWQRFEDVSENMRVYHISNKTYRATEASDIGEEIAINQTIWADLQEDAAYENVRLPLFSIFKMPVSNNIDLSSPLGVSIFSNAQKELKLLDIACTCLQDEMFGGKKIDKIDSIDYLLNLLGVKCGYSPGQFVLNGKTEQMPAAKNETGKKETVQLINQIRDSLQIATDGLIYALDKYADIYSLAPIGGYETVYSMADI